MDNSTPSMIPALVTSLGEGWQWGLAGIFAAILLGYLWYKKTKKDIDEAREKTKNDIDHAREYLERCIGKSVQIKETQENPSVSRDCKKILEDAKQIQDSNSNYDWGLSKAAIGDLSGAEVEFDKSYRFTEGRAFKILFPERQCKISSE